MATRERLVGGEDFADLAGTLDRFEAASLDLVEMVLASKDDWDRYAASQWLNVADWLAANPDDPEAGEIRADRDESRRLYLTDGRDCVGWGVFVLRRRQASDLGSSVGTSSGIAPASEPPA